MQDSGGYIIVATIILLFTVGCGSLIIDSLINRSEDTFDQNYIDQKYCHKASASSTIRFLENDN